jgi:hypothetical protein
VDETANAKQQKHPMINIILSAFQGINAGILRSLYNQISDPE